MRETYKIGDWVWFMDNNKPMQKQVVGSFKDSWKNEYYLFNQVNEMEDTQKIEMKLCFKDKKELLKSLE